MKEGRGYVRGLDYDMFDGRNNTHTQREEGLGWSIPPKFLCDLSTVVILVFSSACIYPTSSLTRHAGIHDKTANKSVIVRDLVQNIPATSDAQKKNETNTSVASLKVNDTDRFVCYPLCTVGTFLGLPV